MTNLCGECTFYDIKGSTRWGNEHYCEKEGKFYPPTRSACRNFIKRENKDGYQRAGADCYITTIVCTIMGYQDNCELLQTLRNFREKYLKLDKSFWPILQEYDQVGPIISKKILDDNDSKIAAMEILRNFLIPCVKQIKENNFEQAIEIYKKMVLLLKLKYGLLGISINLEASTPIEDLGKGRTRIQNQFI